MASPIVPHADDVYWRFNGATRQVEIIADGVVLEVTTVARAADRVTFHRGELAKAAPVTCVEASAYKRHNRSR